MFDIFFIAQNTTAYAAARKAVLPPTISAPYAELFDLTHHQQLVAKVAATETDIASTTKIMTALLVIEAGNLDLSIGVKQAYIDYVNKNNATGP